MFEPRGIIAAMSTPFYEDESINEQELRNQVNRFIKAGLHGIFTLGTNGENYAMSFDEKVRVMKVVIDEAAGRIPVYAGTGCVTTKETIELTKIAKELGADCASIITPYFAENSQKGLIKHYTAIANAVDMPILIYNMPARTGVNVEPATAHELAKIPNIVGIKDSSGNFDQMQLYLEPLRNGKLDVNFAVLSGNDSLILWNLMGGGAGGITGISNVLPETMVSIYKLWEQGDFKAALRVQDSIRPLRNCMKLANPNTVVKVAAGRVGQKLGPVRAPFDTISEQLDKAIDNALAEVKAMNGDLR